jgi:hypothetical protein
MMADYQAALTLRSTNVKTGPIPVSTTTADTCAEDCPFREGACYARGGPLRIFWDAVTKKTKGKSWKGFCADVAAIPDKTLWRHNQAGDLPGDGVLLDRDAILMLVEANKGKKGFTYTHYTVAFEWNAAIIDEANYRGFTVNVSADSIEHADLLKELTTAPIVCVLPIDYPDTGGKTPAGHRIVVCPATVRDDVNCMTCKLCASSVRKMIVGFRAHGCRARQADAVARGGATG